jgi:hypothetical protein
VTEPVHQVVLPSVTQHEEDLVSLGASHSERRPKTDVDRMAPWYVHFDNGASLPVFGIVMDSNMRILASNKMPCSDSDL